MFVFAFPQRLEKLWPLLYLTRPSLTQSKGQDIFTVTCIPPLPPLSSFSELQSGSYTLEYPLKEEVGQKSHIQVP